LVAGDDDPYHRYKREKFVRDFLPKIGVEGKTVMELGCGPGGNLKELAKRRPAQLIGVDISDDMLKLAGESLTEVTLKKTDGHTLPFSDRSVDLAYTVTVLQHNVTPVELNRLAGELSRVAKDQIICVEDIGTTTHAEPGVTYVTRPVSAYREAFASHGFTLTSTTPLGLKASRFVRKAVGKVILRNHPEGEPITGLANLLLKATMPVTRILDRIIPDNGDVTLMVFDR
jgi:ubiquinone/menaquinone biosynthesis C-methylase UbiE